MDQLIQFISNHIGLCVSLIIIIIALFIFEIFEQKKRPQSLTPASAVDLINNNNAIVIDLRDETLFNTGHIINAIRASVQDFSTPRMAKYKTKPIILVCERGVQSTTLASKLRTEGFTEPMALTGGIQAWLAANLPLIKKG